MISNKNIKILISPAHYYFSDKFGSEPGYAYSLVRYIGMQLPTIDVIVGSIDILSPLPSNINLIPIYKARSKNPSIELLKYLFFYPLVCFKYIQLHRRYNIIHHMFPTSPVTIDPLLLLVKLLSPKTKIIIGPLQLLSELNSPEDLSTMLVGKQHTSFFTSILPSIYSFLIFITTPLAKLTFRTADVIVCNFTSIKKHYLSVYPTKPIEVIPTGVDPLTAKLNSNKKERKSVTIICVGKLQTHKGQQYLLEAFSSLVKKYPNVTLLLIGEGNMKDNFVRFVKKHNLTKKVVFTGFIPRTEVPKWYAKADIFCLPSLIDTNPVVVQEAMSHTLPVVASNVGAVAEIVGKAGFIVEKGNSSQLSKALEKMVKDKSLREKMGILGYNKVKNHFTWDIIAQQWIHLYKSL